MSAEERGDLNDLKRERVRVRKITRHTREAPVSTRQGDAGNAVFPYQAHGDLFQPGKAKVDNDVKEATQRILDSTRQVMLHLEQWEGTIRRDLKKIQHTTLADDASINLRGHLKAFVQFLAKYRRTLRTVSGEKVGDVHAIGKGQAQSQGQNVRSAGLHGTWKNMDGTYRSQQNAAASSPGTVFRDALTHIGPNDTEENASSADEKASTKDPKKVEKTETSPAVVISGKNRANSAGYVNRRFDLRSRRTRKNTIAEDAAKVVTEAVTEDAEAKPPSKRIRPTRVPTRSPRPSATFRTSSYESCKHRLSNEKVTRIARNHNASRGVQTGSDLLSLLGHEYGAKYLLKMLDTRQQQQQSPQTKSLPRPSSTNVPAAMRHTSPISEYFEQVLGDAYHQTDTSRHADVTKRQEAEGDGLTSGVEDGEGEAEPRSKRGRSLSAESDLLSRYESEGGSADSVESEPTFISQENASIQRDGHEVEVEDVTGEGVPREMAEEAPNDTEENVPETMGEAMPDAADEEVSVGMGEEGLYCTDEDALDIPVGEVDDLAREVQEWLDWHASQSDDSKAKDPGADTSRPGSECLPSGEAESWPYIKQPVFGFLYGSPWNKIFRFILGSSKGGERFVVRDVPFFWACLAITAALAFLAVDVWLYVALVRERAIWLDANKFTRAYYLSFVRGHRGYWSLDRDMLLGLGRRTWWEAIGVWLTMGP
ncbi:hypothetical protein N3K66_000696 [Trichothecium roseum]|uniref:Uncharacterized protein n=1 Tax=Trichothecium roseum TaxID=47278 RepID=A0ACC0VCJ4_9HYPO|nr:hypothetical protein N3K66_000696 [Trichothecium roseum]